MYTGGTTGAPKGVMLTHGALKFNALACSAHGSYFANDLYLHAAPMFHIADNANSGAASLFGAGHIFIPAFDPALVMNTIAEHKVTCTVLVPTMIGMVLDHPEFEREKLSSLRRLIYGASPMPEALLRRLLEVFPEMELVQGYGMTEMGPLISILPSEDHTLTGEHTKRLKSAGRPAAGVDVKICGEDGVEVKQGEVGEIVINSPGHMLGYWNKEEATAEVLKDDWVFSGDCGYFDEDGFLYIVDRKKDMIVTGGENVYSAEVENAISLHPDVAGVAVIGVPSDKWGEIVHAIVIPKPGSNVSEESIVEHTRKLVANYKIPREISFREEPFPLSGAGKVLKKDLRAPFWEGKETQV
jgi:acyl-CoA synthetase (AMP-forming)/AMP-acid ligase II